MGLIVFTPFSQILNDNIKREVKGILFLLALLFIFFSTFSYIFLLHYSNGSLSTMGNSFSKRNNHPFPISQFAVQQISGTGAQLFVDLRAIQEETIITNIHTDFSVSLQNLTLYKSVLFFNDLNPKNYTKTIETDNGEGYYDLRKIPTVSFSVPTTCYLRSISVNVTGNTGITVYIEVYNSTWDSIN
ncbi:MAG: hypothetical protein J7L07_07245, partial [Candidatus Odinarchaeota archaeon]|nr:hypothetical protein [Candidatus Odinarchaeota archaeon]